MLLRTVIASLALWIVSVAQAEEPQWLKDARAREGQAIAPVAIKSKDGWFRATVPAKVVGDIVKEDGSYNLALDAGADASIYCEVVPDGVDMGDMLRRTADMTLKQVEAGAGKVEARQVESSDAGVIGDVPYLQIRWLYRVNDGKEARVGALQQVIFEKLGHSIYCAQVALGYVKTFAAVTQSLAQSFEAPPAATAAPYYYEVDTIAIAGVKLGITLTRLEHDQDGDTKATILTAMAQPAPNGTLRAHEALEINWIKPDGSLINAAYTASEDGEIVSDVVLERAAGAWVIHGESQGKKLDDKLAADAQPGTWVARALALRKLLAAGNPVGVMNITPLWVSPDFGKLTEQRTKVLAKKGADRFTAHFDLGALSAETVLDASLGLPVSAEIATGTQTLRLERVHVNGSF
jgi:hypothetical protein